MFLCCGNRTPGAILNVYGRDLGVLPQGGSVPKQVDTGKRQDAQADDRIHIEKGQVDLR